VPIKLGGRQSKKGSAFANPDVAAFSRLADFDSKFAINLIL